MEVGPGQIVVNSANLMHRRTEAACHWGSMSLTPDDLADASRAIAGRELRVPSLTHVIQPSSAMMSRLLNLHEMVGKIAKTTPDILELPEVARALEQELILLMIRCLTENETSKVSAGTLRHGTIVARFEEFLEANPHRLIYLTEICAAIDVPERTLRDACEKHLGMGPVRYLNLRRMHLARRALLRADPSTETVTAIATDHGFWELGHFSVAYKALFGESPSASLHRPDDDRQIFLNRPSSLESFDLA
jgi:AraC-like DNA-binding protein